MKRASGRSSATFLDTQILVWLSLDPARLTAVAADHIAMASSGLSVSAVNAFEYRDLNRRARFGYDVPLDPLLVRLEITVVDFPSMAVDAADALPDIHRDPVDRMLIGHALVTGAAIITADATIRRYPVPTIW